MAESRSSFLDSPSYSSIVTPTQRSALESRRSRTYAGGGGGGSSIRRLTREERREQQRQQDIEELRSDVQARGGRLSREEQRAIKRGEPISDIREQVRERQTRQGFARLQRDLSRSGASLSEAEAQAILEGESPSAVRERVRQRRGRTFASDRVGGFVSARGESVPVTPGAAELIQQRQEEGGFERVRRESRARQTQSFASETGLGGASLQAGGTAVVTPSGETVGPASFEPNVSSVEGPARVSDSGTFVLASRETGGITAPTTRQGRIVTSQQRRRTTPTVVSEFEGEGRFASTLRAIGEQPGTGFTGREAADFAGGFQRGFSQQGLFRSYDQLAGVTERGRQEFQQISGSTRGSRSAFATGVGLGAAGQGAALFGAGQAIGFVGRAAAPLGTRIASSLGFGSAASRAAAGTVAASIGGSALVAPRFVSATRRGVETDSLGRELSLATLQTGAEAGLLGAGASRQGVVRSGRRAGQAVDAAVPRFGSLSPLSTRSPAQAAQLQVTRAMPRPSTRISSFVSRGVSVRPGSLAVSTTQRGITGGAGRSRTFLTPGTGGFAVPGSAGNILTGNTFLRPQSGLRQQTLTFGPQRSGVSRIQPFPQVTAGAASNAARNARAAGRVTELYAGGSQALLADRPSPNQISRSQLRRALQGRSRRSVSQGLPRWLGSGARGRESFVDAARLPSVTDTGVSRSLSEFTGRIQRTPRRPSRVVPDEPTTTTRSSRRSQRSTFDNLVFSDPTGGVATTIGRSIDRFGPISSLRRTRTSRFSPRSIRRGAGRSPSAPRGARRTTSSGFAAGLGGAAVSSALRSFQRSRDLTRTNTGFEQASPPQFDTREGFSFDVDFSPRFDTGTQSRLTPGTDQTQIQRQTPRITGGFDFNFGRPGGPGGPPTGGGTPPPPGIPLPQIPDFGQTRTRRGPGRGTRREEQFTPSLVAQALNIRGERPSRELTGLEIRPITFRGNN